MYLVRFCCSLFPIERADFSSAACHCFPPFDRRRRLLAIATRLSLFFYIPNSQAARWTADVVLRGYCGYNRRWALKVMERMFPDNGVWPIAVTVFFGANDACLPDRCSGFQHVLIAEFKENLQAIVSFFKVSIYRIFGLSERTNEVACSFARAIVVASKEGGVHVIDLWTIMQKNLDWKTYLRDANVIEEG